MEATALAACRVKEFTLDTGALIAIERRKQRMTEIYRNAVKLGLPIVVPSVCIAEWWRGRTDQRDEILSTLLVVHTDDDLMKRTGRALAAVPGATTIDAIVMATAAQRNGVVFTSDVDDLMALKHAFNAVRVLGV
jgi:predicted nucleic acid-binding protein